jgi:hypothetical protein
MVNEKFTAQIYGVTRTSPLNCVCHNEPQNRSAFGDEISFKEFGISGLCQREQDAIFGDDEGFPIEDDT